MTRRMRVNAGAKLAAQIASYEDAEAFFERARWDRALDNAKLAHNTHVVRLKAEEAYAVRLHKTLIVTLYKNGTIKLDSGGYQTATTKASMNEVLKPMGLTIDQRASQWYVREIGSATRTVKYFDGMVIEVRRDALQQNPRDERGVLKLGSKMRTVPMQSRAFRRVVVSAQEVAAFRRTWPVSGLPRDVAVAFEFAPNGDLVGMEWEDGNDYWEAETSGAAKALADDAQNGRVGQDVKQGRMRTNPRRPNAPVGDATPYYAVIAGQRQWFGSVEEASDWIEYTREFWPRKPVGHVYYRDGTLIGPV